MSHTSKKKKSSAPITPSVMESSAAQQVFERVRSQLESLKNEDLEPMRIDVQLAAAIAHSVAVRDSADVRTREFQRLERGEFYEVARIGELADLALAAWFARHRQLGRSALASAAQVPEVVFRDAQDRRARMLRVLEHWVGDDPEIGVELAAIRSGAGYQDLANDLEALAELYQREPVRALIGHDSKHFRADDSAAARRNAQAIFKGLGISEENEAQVWAEWTQRAWTLLSRAYTQHQRCGSFLFWDAEDVMQTYPSLVTAVRAPGRPRTPRGEGADTEAGVPPVPPSVPSSTTPPTGGDGPTS